MAKKSKLLQQVEAAAKRDAKLLTQALFGGGESDDARLDAGSSMKGKGKDVEVPVVAAQALAELRASCASLCALLPEVDKLADSTASTAKCAPNVLKAAESLVNEIFENAEVAQMRLARKPAEISRRKS
jgi:hypothetical protein